jgi:heme-degrading monooxygenase HmoA
MVSPWGFDPHKIAVPTHIWVGQDDQHAPPRWRVTWLRPFPAPTSTSCPALRTQPGYVSTALHQSITPQADFRFINVAQWASAAEFRAATSQLGAQGVQIPYRPHPSLYEVVQEDKPAATSESAVVLINPFEVPAGADEEFITSWEAAHDYLRGQSGYLHTRLHRNILPDADFRFVNIAGWESAEAFRAAVESRGFQETGRPPYPAHLALYRVVRL